MLSTPASLPTLTGKHMSLYKRKSAPAPTPLEIEAADIRYPPFDLEDPFASLVELRRRSCSFNCNVDQHAAMGRTCVAQPTSTAPFDLPHLSSKAFPSVPGRRYTLAVALPGPVSPLDTAPDAIPTDSAGIRGPGSELGVETTDRQEALKSLTKRSTANRPDADSNRSQNLSHSVQKSGSDLDCDRHHRRYSHIADFFRDASAVQPTKRHYIPRKVLSLSYMYTLSLTPDLSRSSSEDVSSSSLLLDPTMSMAQTPRSATFVDKSAGFYETRGPSSSTTSLIRKLIPKRSVASLSSIPRRKREWEVIEKDLPDLPMISGSPAPSIPFPCASAPPSISDISLSSARGLSSDPFRNVSPAAQEDKGYATAPEYRAGISNAHLDAGLVPQRKSRLFSFSSRSLLSSRVDLYESKKALKVQTMNYPFEEYALPTPEQLQAAASLFVVAESGVRLRFGDLWKLEQTVVIFVRHFRFHACQDYVRSIASEVDVDTLEKAGLKIVVIGLGPHSLIAPYRQLTDACFPIYTDPTLALHRALGMSLKKTNPGPNSERGHYITNGNSGIGMLRRTLVNAVSQRLVLPLFERGGDGAQLGGEFVLGPGVTCAFGHRMRHTRGHAPILDVVTASGVQTPSLRRTHRMILQRQEQGLGGQDVSMYDEDAWMAQRRRSLARLKRKRQNRRAGGVDAAAATAEKIRAGDALDVKKSRFSIVEEDDEENEEMYVRASETDPRRYDLRIDIHRQCH
ncbi:hypothetical protein EW145_g2610 [Phellinidium pouzarii]|uniref:Uncharacterized protein n=1 Tax=Phellinidium pouzarii TaxID=167371 RepID=A0A4S4LA61_9AGAM|nr:hypothetical protein EW145_g2610 [Phellinidium pouzarii]